MRSEDLDRFVRAQAGTLDAALAELGRGRKTTHWMWFVFPQLRALGMSPTAKHFGIADLDEARAYLAHPVLGPRLEAAVAAVQSSPAASLEILFGFPDHLKFRSCMTLFAAAAPGGAGEPYRAALDRWCPDGPDPRTLTLLGAPGAGDADA